MRAAYYGLGKDQPVVIADLVQPDYFKARADHPSGTKAKTGHASTSFGILTPRILKSVTCGAATPPAAKASVKAYSTQLSPI